MLDAEIYTAVPSALGCCHPILALQTNPSGALNAFAAFNLQVQAGGQLNFFMGNGVSATQYGYSSPLLSASLFPAAQWVTLKVQVVGTAVTFWVDGAVRASGTFSGTRQTSSTEPIRLGYYNGGGAYAQTADPVQIRGAAVTAPQLPPPSPPPPACGQDAARAVESCAVVERDCSGTSGVYWVLAGGGAKDAYCLFDSTGVWALVAKFAADDTNWNWGSGKRSPSSRLPEFRACA